MSGANSIELCGIKLGDTFDENKFKVVKKEAIPGGDYMSEIAKPSLMGRMQSTSTYFKNVNIVHSIGSKEISMIIADNGGGYSRKDCLDIINELNDYYLEKYGDHYDMYVQEVDKALWYIYYFYPPNHNVISFEDPKSSELREPVTSLWLMANQEQFDEYRTLEAVLCHYHEEDDDKSPEELDNTQEKTFLKVAGLRQ